MDIKCEECGTTFVPYGIASVCSLCRDMIAVSDPRRYRWSDGTWVAARYLLPGDSYSVDESRPGYAYLHYRIA